MTIDVYGDKKHEISNVENYVRVRLENRYDRLLSRLLFLLEVLAGLLL